MIMYPSNNRMGNYAFSPIQYPLDNTYHPTTQQYKHNQYIQTLQGATNYDILLYIIQTSIHFNIHNLIDSTKMVEIV